MNRILLALVIAGVAGGLILAASLPEQTAVAGFNKKFHFTQTLISAPDPAVDREGLHMTMILSPNKGTIYDGSLTFSANDTVDAAVLHELGPDDDYGQPTWTVDGQTVYGLTQIPLDADGGTLEYAGAALALYSDTKFAATVTVDGWIRGQPTEIVLQNPVRPQLEPSLALSRASVPATIPLHEGTHEAGRVLYIITDASDAEWADQVSELQQWQVELAPPIADAPEDSLNTMYVFTNGQKGEGVYGYQSEVFEHTPAQAEYSALSKMVEITWRPGQNQKAFEYASDIQDAVEAGRVTVRDAGIVVNAPQIVWPDGQMEVRPDSAITDGMEYGGGQITQIDEEGMTVTFVAHRGWGPDGRTIYYIVTDATPSGPAEAMGVTDAPAIAPLIANPAAVDLYQFSNGLKGPGPMGFQPGVASAALGDETYSPMWRIYLVSWNDPEDASLLETVDDITHYSGEEMVTVSLARPMNADHIVNCPFIDPFQ